MIFKCFVCINGFMEKHRLMMQTQYVVDSFGILDKIKTDHWATLPKNRQQCKIAKKAFSHKFTQTLEKSMKNKIMQGNWKFDCMYGKRCKSTLYNRPCVYSAGSLVISLACHLSVHQLVRLYSLVLNKRPPPLINFRKFFLPPPRTLFGPPRLLI